MVIEKVQTSTAPALQSRIIRVVQYDKDSHRVYLICLCCGHKERIDE
jgi:hypothetical protein